MFVFFFQHEDDAFILYATNILNLVLSSHVKCFQNQIKQKPKQMTKSVSIGICMMMLVENWRLCRHACAIQSLGKIEITVYFRQMSNNLDKFLSVFFRHMFHCTIDTCIRSRCHYRKRRESV